MFCLRSNVIFLGFTFLGRIKVAIQMIFLRPSICTIQLLLLKLYLQIYLHVRFVLPLVFLYSYIIIFIDIYTIGHAKAYIHRHRRD